MKCRWADILLDWLCCTDWGLFCVLDSKQVDIYGLCIQFCSWYIKLHSTKTMIKRWFKKNLREKCKQFLLRCFALSSVCLPIYQRWQQASSGIEIKICNNQSSSKLLQFGPKSRKIKTKKFLKMSLENNNHCLNITCICWEGHNSTLTEM